MLAFASPSPGFLECHGDVCSSWTHYCPSSPRETRLGIPAFGACSRSQALISSCTHHDELYRSLGSRCCPFCAGLCVCVCFFFLLVLPAQRACSRAVVVPSPNERSTSRRETGRIRGLPPAACDNNIASEATRARCYCGGRRRRSKILEGHTGCFPPFDATPWSSTGRMDEVHRAKDVPFAPVRRRNSPWVIHVPGDAGRGLRGGNVFGELAYHHGHGLEGKEVVAAGSANRIDPWRPWR